jgi:hypothetical protein
MDHIIILIISTIFKRKVKRKKILPVIKVRKNSIISSKNNKPRNREIYSQSNGLLKWRVVSIEADELLNCFFFYKADVW